MGNIFGEELKKIVLAGIGAVAVSAEKSKEVVDELIKKGEVTVEQGKILNEELKRKINEKTKEVKNENKEVKNDKVSEVLDELSKMTPEELEKIKAKLQDEEEKSE